MNEETIYHDRAVLICSIMQTDGWKEFQKVIAERKQGCLERIARSESGIEVASVEKKGNGITIVILNKDELQHELALLSRLEGQFKDWQIEAAKKPEYEGAHSER
jgi:hypothetical protein